MTEHVADLESNLKQQITIYRHLVKLEQEKQQALVDNVIEKIENITAQEEKILLEVGSLEEERLDWAEFFAKETGKSAEEIYLTDLVNNYPELEPIRGELERVIDELRQLNETNTKLLQNAVNIVNFSFNLLTTDRKSTYSNPADQAVKRKDANRSLIDRNI